MTTQVHLFLSLLLCWTIAFATDAKGQVLQSILGDEPTSLSQTTLGSVIDFRVDIQEAFQADSISAELDSITLNGRLLQKGDQHITTLFRRLGVEEGELILRIDPDTYLLPGLYTVRNQVLVDGEVADYHYQSFIIEPAEIEIKAPLELSILKGDPMEVTLFVEEVSGLSGIWDLRLKPVSWADSDGEVQLVEAQFVENPPPAIEEDGVQPVTLRIPLASMPLGRYAARFYLDSDNITSPVPVLIDVTVQRGMAALIFALLAGLFLSFIAKVYLDARQRRNALFSDVVELKKALVELESSYEDADFRAVLKKQHGPLDAVGHGLIMRIDADLKTIGDIRATIESEKESLDDELSSIQEELDGWYESLSEPYSLPQGIMEDVARLKPSLDDAYTVLSSRNRHTAYANLDTVHNQISILKEKVREMSSAYNAINLTTIEAYLVSKKVDVVSWRNTTKRMDVLASHDSIDPGQMQTLLQLGGEGHQGALAMYRVLTESLKNELSIARDEFESIEQEDGRSIYRLLNDVIQALKTADGQEKYDSSAFSDQVLSNLLGPFEEELEALGRFVREYIGGVPLKEESGAIRDSWTQGDFLGALSAISQDMRHQSADSFEDSRGEELDLEMARPRRDKSVEAPPAPPVVPAPEPESAPSRGAGQQGVLRKAWDKLTAPPLRAPTAVPLSVRDVEFRAWKSAVLGKVVHTAIFGALAILMGYITFAPDFTGTLPDFAAAIFWAFGLDFSAGAFLERTELG